MTEPAPPDRVTPLIARLDQALTAKRPDYCKLLRAGAPDPALDMLERRYSLKLPAAFRALYRWHDGQDVNASVALYKNRMWLPLDEVRETKDMLDGMIGFDFEDPRWWRRGWVPFMHNGGGSYLCVDLAAEDGGTPGQIVEYWKADGDRPVTYSDFEAWLGEVAGAIESA